MIGRIPLWATLLPLLLGVAVWAFVWRGYEAGFEADLRKVLPADAEIEAGGFPYRLEARLGEIKLEHRDAALELGLATESMAVNRVPWQRDRQVISLGQSQARAALGPIAGADVVIDSPAAQASLRLEEARIARGSAVWQQPTIRTGLFAAPVRAAEFQAHLRETPATGAARTEGRLPTQVQLVLGGREVRIGAGASLEFRLVSELTATQPVASLSGWRSNGTVELQEAVLSDSTGEVARLKGRLVAEPSGALRLDGVIETVCPASVRAAVAGLPPVAEQRSRRPEQVAVSGTLPGGLVAAPRDPAKPPPPVRAQEPPCPRLR
jgi:hypothetical protein